MPPLEEIEEGEEEEDFEDDPELIPADDDEATRAPAQSRKHKKLLIIQQKYPNGKIKVFKKTI